MSSKNDVFDAVKSYNEANKRPIPKRDILAKFGENGLTHLKNLASDGTIACRRGRNGGYFVKDDAIPTVEDAPVEAANAPQSDPTDEIDVGHLAEQFAALEARLAAEEAEAQNEEAAPF